MIVYLVDFIMKILLPNVLYRMILVLGALSKLNITRVSLS